MPKGPFDLLGEGLKTLIGDTIRQGRGDMMSVMQGLGQVVATPKALATLVVAGDSFRAWHLLTDPPVLVAVYTPAEGEPFAAAAVLDARKEPTELATELVDTLKGAAQQ